jgi:hypothetical protein
VRLAYCLMVGVGLCMATPTVQAQEQVAPMQVALSADQKLAEAVATELQSSGATGFAIDITCNKGVVELTGVVRDQSEKSKILNTVSRVAGVKKVQEKLVVREAKGIRQVGGELPSPPLQLPPGAVPMQNGPMPGPMPLPGPGPVGGMGEAGIGDPLPVFQPQSADPYNPNAPRMPGYAWPTYAPYNNLSRVAYPNYYPYNAWPFIGPFYPFPKVPLGWRSIRLEWEDGHWYYGRQATRDQYWRIRYW